jgi:hypothetical protein
MAKKKQDGVQEPEAAESPQAEAAEGLAWPFPPAFPPAPVEQTQPAPQPQVWKFTGPAGLHIAVGPRRDIQINSAGEFITSELEVAVALVDAIKSFPGDGVRLEV